VKEPNQAPIDPADSTATAAVSAISVGVAADGNIGPRD